MRNNSQDERIYGKRNRFSAGKEDYTAQKAGQKTYLPLDGQIEKLKADGLLIEDEAHAKARLKWEGYYNFAVGYNRLFRQGGKRYFQGTTFRQVEALYDFDKHLRGIVYEYAQSLECTLKAFVSDVFSKNYGVHENKYLAEENFTTEEGERGNVRWLISTCKEALRDAVKSGASTYRDYVAHNATTYGHVPLWALIRTLSFGNASKFLKLMKPKDKKEIAAEYGLSGAKLCNMMELAVCFRNIAAHGERVYCAALPSVRLTEELEIFSSLQTPRNANGTLRFGRNDFLSFLIVLKYLLPPKEFSVCLERVKKEVDELASVLPPVAMNRVYEVSGLSGSWRKLDKIRVGVSARQG